MRSYRHSRFRVVSLHLLQLVGLAATLSVLVATNSALSRTTEYLIDTWSGDNGLRSSSITAIAQTPEGYLWIGTHNGLARFDGVRFVTFDPLNTPELKHARVRGLFVDGRGTLWVNAYDNALTRWRNGVFTNEYGGQQVASVFTFTNEILFAMQGGDLVSRNGSADGPGEWRLFKPAGRTTGRSYHKDGDGVLWYGTRDGGVGRLNGGNSEVLSQAASGLDGQRVNYLTADPSENIYVGTDKGIAVWSEGRFRDVTPTNGEPSLDVSFVFCTSDGGCWVVANQKVRKCVDRRWVAEAESWGELFGDHTPALHAYEDRQGGVWFCHFGQGVFHVTRYGEMRRISSADGLPGNRITCWFEDREGNVWVGVDRGGLVRLREKHFQVVGQAEGLSVQGAVSVCEDRQGAMWIGTYGGGLNRWVDGRLTSFMLPEGPTKGFIFSAYPDAEDRIWLSAGREDFFVYEHGKITQPPWTVHGIKAMLVDRQNRLWLGRKNGLSCLKDGVLESFGSASGFQSVDVHALAEGDNGDIWVGTGNGALYRLNSGRSTAYQAEGRLARQAVWSLLPDADGAVWVGTFRGGLLRFKNGEFTRYTTDDGLPSDVICQILDDGMGNLWIGSHAGIFQVSKSALNEFADGTRRSVPCVAYGIYDGLPSLECSGGYNPSAWRSRDGRLWFSTFKGLVSIQPERIQKNRLPPPVVLEELLVDGKSALRSLDGQKGAGSDLLLPAGKHYFEFRYTALSYVAPDKVRFRYKLEGLDDNWLEAGDRRDAHYSHLPPGEYTFRVSACNNDGVWNEAGDALAFTVLPHFYETRWFQALVGLLLFGTVAGVMRFIFARRMHIRMEQLERQRAVERERERIARDIHDDLGAGLTQIMLQSALARRAKREEAPAHIDQIAETAHELVGAMDEIVWAVNPESDTLDEVVNYLGHFSQEYVTRAGLRCWLDLPTQTPCAVVPAETRHNLFLAVKEVLNNVVKHSRATDVTLQFTMQRSGFSFIIKDNGVGFAPAAQAAASNGRVACGHGLSNLASRLEKIGGSCNIKSGAGNGTEVELTVMLQTDSRSGFEINHRDGTNN